MREGEKQTETQRERKKGINLARSQTGAGARTLRRVSGKRGIQWGVCLCGRSSLSGDNVCSSYVRVDQEVSFSYSRDSYSQLRAFNFSLLVSWESSWILSGSLWWILQDRGAARSFVTHSPHGPPISVVPLEQRNCEHWAAGLQVTAACIMLHGKAASFWS